MEQPKVDLNPQEIQMAANAGVQLLQTPGAVSVPSPMACSGVMKTLLQLLMAIASREVAVINIPVKLADAPPPAEPLNKEVADAVAAAVESSGNSEKSPVAKSPVAKVPAEKIPAGEVSER